MEKPTFRKAGELNNTMTNNTFGTPASSSAAHMVSDTKL